MTGGWTAGGGQVEGKILGEKGSCEGKDLGAEGGREGEGEQQSRRAWGGKNQEKGEWKRMK